MECIVAAEARMQDGIMIRFISIESRIHGLHAKVKADNKIVEIEAKAQTIADSHLAGEIT